MNNEKTVVVDIPSRMEIAQGILINFTRDYQKNMMVYEMLYMLPFGLILRTRAEFNLEDYEEAFRYGDEDAKNRIADGIDFHKERLIDKVVAAYKEREHNMNKPKKPWAKGLPPIEKIDTYNDRVTKVTFTDGTFTKAVCSDNDHFDLDVGITICAIKRMFGERGTAIYNDFLRYAHHVITEKDIANEKLAKEKAEARMKRRKAELRKAAKEFKAKQEQINIQVQAIVQAHEEIEARKREEGLE